MKQANKNPVQEQDVIELGDVTVETRGEGMGSEPSGIGKKPTGVISEE